MFIKNLVKMFTGKNEKKEELPVTVIEVDINTLPEKEVEWIRRIGSKIK